MRAFSPVDRRMPSRRTGLKPASSTSSAVFAWRQARRRVDAIARGHGHPLTIRPCFSDRDGRAGNGCPGLIVHDAGDLAGGGLGTCWRRGGTPRARDDEANRECVSFELVRIVSATNSRPD